LLDSREKEARTSMSLDNAKTNFSSAWREEDDHLRAMIEASAAEKDAREYLTPNV